MVLFPDGGLRVRHDRVEVVPSKGPDAVLVRPGGYVAWAVRPDDGTLDAAPAAWFGERLETAA
ncbi:hypothetical protein [Nonomuraea sp. NPDC050783]|uniref:aromatic-ring hydroxylase C-terminal domain-containing protein n=1 Tax=Nonomuraea sp. NPDC050783 TaxID=3154634 RepID=UPI0034655BD8